MEIQISHTSMEPIYEQIAGQIRLQIREGTLQAQDPLPSVRGFAREYRVSALTVKKAYDMLVQEGFIYRKQGLGSFVLSKNMDDGEVELQERELQGFTRTARGHADTKLLHFKLVFAPKDIADHLGIRENDPLYDILRVRNIFFVFFEWLICFEYLGY